MRLMYQQQSNWKYYSSFLQFFIHFLCHNFLGINQSINYRSLAIRLMLPFIKFRLWNGYLTLNTLKMFAYTQHTQMETFANNDVVCSYTILTQIVYFFSNFVAVFFHWKINFQLIVKSQKESTNLLSKDSFWIVTELCFDAFRFRKTIVKYMLMSYFASCFLFVVVFSSFVCIVSWEERYVFILSLSERQSVYCLFRKQTTWMATLTKYYNSHLLHFMLFVIQTDNSLTNNISTIHIHSLWLHPFCLFMVPGSGDGGCC